MIGSKMVSRCRVAKVLGWVDTVVRREVAGRHALVVGESQHHRPDKEGLSDSLPHYPPAR